MNGTYRLAALLEESPWNWCLESDRNIYSQRKTWCHFGATKTWDRLPVAIINIVHYVWRLNSGTETWIFLSFVAIKFKYCPWYKNNAHKSYSFAHTYGNHMGAVAVIMLITVAQRQSVATTYRGVWCADNGVTPAHTYCIEQSLSHQAYEENFTAATAAAASRSLEVFPYGTPLIGVADKS